MNRITHFEFIRFILIGGLNTLFAYIIVVIFLLLNFHYTIATLFSAIVSITSGYFLNKKLVFIVSKAKSIFIYYLFWAIMYFFNIFIQFFLLELSISSNLYLNSFIATILVTITSYLTNKFYFFKKIK